MGAEREQRSCSDRFRQTFGSAPPPGASRRSPVGKVISTMPLGSGRLEKRIEVSIPLQISTILDPDAAEQTTTENVCSLGMRILTGHARQLNERLMITSLRDNMRRLARVVYCQRLPDGHFAVGLQFQGNAVKWAKESASPGTVLATVLTIFFPRFVFWAPAAVPHLLLGVPGQGLLIFRH